MNKEEFLKECAKEGLMIYGTTWESNLKRLKELKKYKEMWEELKKIDCIGRGTITLEESIKQTLDVMKYIEQKYFPEKRYFSRPINIYREADKLFKEILKILKENNVQES